MRIFLLMILVALGSPATLFGQSRWIKGIVTGGKTINLPFETLWSLNNENNEEVIFATKYDVPKHITAYP